MNMDQRQYQLNLQPPLRIRKPLPLAVSRIAITAGISSLHAIAFCAANGIGPVGAR